MENGPELAAEKAIAIRDLLVVSGMAIAGIYAIHYLIRHPDNAKRLRMGILLETQKTCHRISDQFRVMADRAGTEYNRVRM